MRICIVGCGAVGSLFAANLATLDDVEVWAFDLSQTHVGAITGLTHGRVCERPDLRALVSGLIDEGKAVASAQGITLDADPEALIDHAAKREVAYEHKASMLQDIEARRPTEIDHLNGGIVSFGGRLGVA